MPGVQWSHLNLNLKCLLAQKLNGGSFVRFYNFRDNHKNLIHTTKLGSIVVLRRRTDALLETNKSIFACLAPSLVTYSTFLYLILLFIIFHYCHVLIFRILLMVMWC